MKHKVITDMMKHRSIQIALLIFALATLFQSSPVFAKQPDPQFANADNVFTLFASRVQIMRAVAYDKWMQRTPIEDKKRETVVLKNAQNDAKTLGIHKIGPLILAQIEIAKSEQRRWHARWDKRGMDSGSAPDLTKSRRQLDKLGKELLPALRNLLPALRNAAWRKTLKTNFDSKLKSLPASERELLWRAMLQAQIIPSKSTPAKAPTK